MSDYNVELEPVGLLGWAVYSSCEGENPRFRAFFVDRHDAEEALKAHRPEDSETPLYFDPGIEPAVLTPHGIVTANDYHITAPDELERLVNDGATNIGELIEP